MAPLAKVTRKATQQAAGKHAKCREATNESMEEACAAYLSTYYGQFGDAAVKQWAHLVITDPGNAARIQAEAGRAVENEDEDDSPSKMIPESRRTLDSLSLKFLAKILCQWNSKFSEKALRLVGKGDADFTTKIFAYAVQLPLNHRGFPRDEDSFCKEYSESYKSLGCRLKGKDPSMVDWKKRGCYEVVNMPKKKVSSIVYFGPPVLRVDLDTLVNPSEAIWESNWSDKDAKVKLKGRTYEMEDLFGQKVGWPAGSEAGESQRSTKRCWSSVSLAELDSGEEEEEEEEAATPESSILGSAASVARTPTVAFGARTPDALGASEVLKALQELQGAAKQQHLAAVGAASPASSELVPTVLDSDSVNGVPLLPMPTRPSATLAEVATTPEDKPTKPRKARKKIS